MSEMEMEMETQVLPACSKKSLANRRLYLKHQQVLMEFPEEHCLNAVEPLTGIDHIGCESFPPDTVARGNTALRLHAADEGSSYARKLQWRCVLDKTRNLSQTPVITLAFSAYDGPHDSQYFEEVAENKYFVEKPDPLLISHSRLSVTVEGETGTATETVALTNYGFNRLYLNFAGEPCMASVKSLVFTYYIEEDVPQWPRICKVDRIDCASPVDFTFAGEGMEHLFSVVNGTVLHRNNGITYEAGCGSSLTLPDLTDAENTVYDVYLPVRNTVWLCLDASVPELDLTVCFKTDQDNRFSDDKQKTLHVSNADERHMVEVNLSDCPAAVGRLTGIRLIPSFPHPENPEGAVTLHLWKVAFEQENPLRPTAGRFLSCTADADTGTVTLTCALYDGYTNGHVEIYDVFPSDIGDGTDGRSCLSKTAVTGESRRLTVQVPLMRGNVTRLASQFQGVFRCPDGKAVPFDGRTVIENWADFCPADPHAFVLPETVFDVEDFGAFGDGFHDDTAAIQAAIDRASEAGGGVVRISGNPLPYGGTDRRYLVTNLYLHSFVELRVETGAVLWQSDDLSHYAVLPRFGHNVAMTGVNWPANHSSGNYPLIYAWREQQCRITGGGQIRMCDTESHSPDGHFDFIGDNVCIGCCDRIHVIPIGFVECENFAIQDLSIIRSSAVYIITLNSRHGYFANLLLDESKCTGADGLWLCGSEGMVYTRILMNNNDDGICLSANYNDPRDMLWSYSYPGAFHGTGHVQLSHSRFNCFTFTASAVSFCTWGTDAPDLETQEVHDIEIFDTVLEGRLSVGGWTDNPYYGKCPFDGSETDDFSPVKNLKMHHCEFRSPLGIQLLRITNFENDFGWPSPSQFEYGDFRRRPAERHEGWTAGLSNWSYDTKEAVRPITLYGVPCAFLRPVRGKPCNLYQGLTLEAGEHVLRFRYKACRTFEAFVRAGDGHDPDDTAVFSFTEAPGGYFKDSEWKEAECRFRVPETSLFHIGVRGTYRSLAALYVTDFHMD